eukprot:CFRG2734T1
MLYTNSESQLTHYYEFVGTGDVKVIFIMGLYGTSAAWEYQKAYFEGSTDFQLLMFDNRGVGKSQSPEGRYTTSMMAYDARGLLDGLGWSSVHIVGVSMGGMISQELALLLGEKRVLSLTLLSTHAGGWSNKIPPLTGVTCFLKAMTYNPKTDMDSIVDNAITMLYGSHTLNDKEKVKKAKEYHEKQIRMRNTNPLTKNGMRGQLLAVNTHYVSEERLKQLGEMNFPKLVMTGDEDILVRASNSKYIAEHIKATYILVEGHGHLLLASYRDNLNPLLAELWTKSGRFSPTA